MASQIPPLEAEGSKPPAPGGGTPREADVLVSGAGPGGSVAGVLLARKGLEVTLLEQSPPGRWKVCGDLLGPRTLHFLQAARLHPEPLLEQGFPILGVRVYDDRRLRSAAFFDRETAGRPWGITLRRDLFDRFLQHRALEAGCTLLHGTRFTRILARETEALLCLARRGAAPLSFRARVLLGADGIQSAAARSAGLLDTRPEGMLVAVRAYFRKVAALGHAIELYFLPHLQPGYAWVIPVDEETANIGLGIRGDVLARDRLNLRAELRRFIGAHPDLSRRMTRAVPLGPVRGWPMRTYRNDRGLAAPRVLLLGDAGGFVDPLSGEGIYGALRSARIAATLLPATLGSPSTLPPSPREYERRCHRAFGADYGSAAFLSGLLSHPTAGKVLARWGLERLQRVSSLDPAYARMVAGLFTGTFPRRGFLRPSRIARVLLS